MSSSIPPATDSSTPAPSDRLWLRSELMGTQVITRDSGRRLGVVGEVVVDIDRREVVALGLRDNPLTRFLPGLPRWMPLASIRQVGDVILVDSADSLSDSFDPERYSKVINCQVISESGVQLGRVLGFSFDIETGDLTTLVIGALGVPLLGEGVLSTWELPVGEIVSSGTDRIIVYEGAEEKLKQLGTGLLEKLGIGGSSWEQEERERFRSGMIPAENQLPAGQPSASEQRRIQPATSRAVRPESELDYVELEERREREPLRQRRYLDEDEGEERWREPYGNSGRASLDQERSWGDATPPEARRPGEERSPQERYRASRYDESRDNEGFYSEERSGAAWPERERQEPQGAATPREGRDAGASASWGPASWSTGPWGRDPGEAERDREPDQRHATAEARDADAPVPPSQQRSEERLRPESAYRQGEQESEGERDRAPRPQGIRREQSDSMGPRPQANDRLDSGRLGAEGANFDSQSLDVVERSRSEAGGALREPSSRLRSGAEATWTAEPGAPEPMAFEPAPARRRPSGPQEAGESIDLERRRDREPAKSPQPRVPLEASGRRPEDRPPQPRRLDPEPIDVEPEVLDDPW